MKMKKLMFKIVGLTAATVSIATPALAYNQNCNTYYNNSAYNNEYCYNYNYDYDCYNTYSQGSARPDNFFDYEYAAKNWQAVANSNGTGYIVVKSDGNKYYCVPSNDCDYAYYTGCDSYGHKPECPNSPDYCKPGTGEQGGNGTGTENGGSSVEVSAYEEKVVELVNIEREKVGLAPLTINKDLVELARVKSQDMKDNNYFSHNSPSLGSAYDMMKAKGVKYSTAGENIAMGQKSPEAVVTAWMNSAGHRANILKSSYTQIGVGYVSSGNYWTQMFIG